MLSDGAGHAFDIERGGRDEVAGVEGAAVVVFDTGTHLDEGLDGSEAGLTRIAPVGGDPVDVA